MQNDHQQKAIRHMCPIKMTAIIITPKNVTIPNKKSEDVLLAVYFIDGIQLLYWKLHSEARRHHRICLGGATCCLVAAALRIHHRVGMDVEEEETFVFLSTVSWKFVNRQYLQNSQSLMFSIISIFNNFQRFKRLYCPFNTSHFLDWMTCM